MSVDERTSALKHAYFIERDKIGIVKVSDTDNSTAYVSPSEIKEVRVHFSKLDEEFISASSGSTGIGVDEHPNIPEEFHLALAYYAIYKGYELNPKTLQAALYWKNLWQEQVSEGKRFANKAKDGSGYHIRQYDF